MSDTSNAIYSHKKFKKATLDAEKRSTLSVPNVHKTQSDSLFSESYRVPTEQTRLYSRRPSDSFQNETNNHNGESISTEPKHIFKPKFQANFNIAKTKQDDCEVRKSFNRPPLQKQLSVDSLIYNKSSTTRSSNISDANNLKGVSWKGLNSPSLEEVSQHITHLIDQNAAIVEYNKPEKLGKLKRYPSIGNDVDTRPVKRSNSTILPMFERKQESQPKDFNHHSLEPKAPHRGTREESFAAGRVLTHLEYQEKMPFSSHLPSTHIAPQFKSDNSSMKHIDERSPVISVDRSRLIDAPQTIPSSPIIKNKIIKFPEPLSHKSELPLNFSSRVDHPPQLTYVSTPNANSNHVFGGEVKIYGNVCKTLIIDSATTTAPSLDLCIAKKQLSADSSEPEISRPTIVTFVETGLNSGGTMVKVSKTPTTTKPFPSSNSLHQTLYSPAASIKSPRDKSSSVSPVPFADRARIKYVPGIPGPYSEAMSYFPITPSVISKPPGGTHKDPLKIPLSDLPIRPKPFCALKSRGSSSEKMLSPMKKTLALDERPRSLKLLSPGNPMSSTALIGSTLISPDTPRPEKSCGQHFLDGSIYTSLNMKVTTRTFYCCIYMPQPMYFIQPINSKVSMYSNWQIRKTEDPLNIGPVEAMSLHRLIVHANRSYTTAGSKSNGIVTPSSYSYENLKTEGVKPEKRETESPGSNSREDSDTMKSSASGRTEGSSPERYIRGRGRGKFVCDACGIRCHKPSMLKKHLRTHSDVRPYMCTHCVFSFKTKGNLTKHLKSKTHFKKCSTLNIDPTHSSCSSEHRLLSSDEMNSDHLFEDDAEGEDESEDSELMCDNDSNYSNSSREHRTCTMTSSSSNSGINYPSDGSDDLPMDLSMKTSSEAGTSKSPAVKPSDIPVLPTITKPFDLLKTVYIHSGKVTASDGTVLQRNLAELHGNSGSMLQKYLKERALFDVAKKTQYIKLPERRFSENMEVDSLVLPAATNLPGCQEEIQKAALKNEAIVEKCSVSFPTLAANITVINSRGENEGISFMSPSGKMPSTASSSYFDELASEDGKCMCTVCHKEFSKSSQLSLHMHVHALERPHRCDSCGISFRAKGHLIKHKRSVGHSNKVSINNTFGTPSEDNPRPFKCDDCSIAFRIHGHLAKHLRSKLHVMKLECMGKVPFGIYAELERSGRNLNDIDTTDCETSLESFQNLASNLFAKDGSSLAGSQINKEESRETKNDAEESDIKFPVAMDQDNPGQ